MILRKMRLFLLGSALLLIAELASATTIYPFQNLGHLTQVADAIYLVKSTDISTEQRGEVTNYYQQFDVLETVKGQQLESVPVKYHSIAQHGKYLSIAGEVRFEPNKTYLLFLRKNGYGEWLTACVSYYIFEDIKVDDQELLVPIYQKGLLNMAEDDIETEPLQNYDKNKLMQELRAVAKQEKTWDAQQAIAPLDYQRSQSKTHKALPSHCNLFPWNPPPRWENMETDPIKVYYQNSGSGCSNMANKMNSVMSYMSSNYNGINLDLAGGISTYSPNCSGGEAQNGNFIGYVDSNLNGKRSIVIMFNDPCNQISNLSGCGGQWALGGIWRYPSQHQYNGTTYSEAAYGHVIVNNGVGACSCGVTVGGNSQTNFTLLITHELTHAIGFNHMSSSVTQANMSGYTCCANAEISALDKQCVDYVYNPGTPSCTDPAAENTNSNQDCTYCSNNVEDGDETGVDCGGSGPGCPVCRGDLSILDCGTMVTTPTSLNVSGIQIRNSGQATISNSHVGYYLSTNNSITTNDYYIGEDYVPSLSVGGSSTESFTIQTHNLDIPVGQYYFGMIADYKKIRSESNEFNNSCSFSNPRISVTSCADGVKNGDEIGVDCGGISCDACDSDLIMASCGNLSISSSTITLTNVLVKNNGNGTSPATRVGYYLSANRTITEDDYFIGSDYVTSLSAGQQSTESFSYSISNLNIPFGRYYVGMIADYQETISETSEVNNTCSKASPRLTLSSCGDGIISGDETGVDCGGSLCPVCDCDPSKVYSSNINSNVTRHANAWIRTSGTVKVSRTADVNFIARNYVLLNPGFEIIKGSQTVVNTQACDN